LVARVLGVELMARQRDANTGNLASCGHRAQALFKGLPGISDFVRLDGSDLMQVGDAALDDLNNGHGFIDCNAHGLQLNGVHKRVRGIALSEQFEGVGNVVLHLARGSDSNFIFLNFFSIFAFLLNPLVLVHGWLVETPQAGGQTLAPFAARALRSA